MGEITKSFLLDQMGRLELNYGKSKFVVDNDVFYLWWDMFKGCNEEGLKLAIDRCIKECEFAPNVGSVMKYYRELSAEHDEYVAEVKRQYGIMRTVWEEKEDVGTLMELYNFSMRYPEKQRKTLLIEYVHQALSFRHDCDACGRKDYPTIKEYIQGKR